MEGLEARRCFSISVSATAIMVPIDVVPVAMDNTPGDGTYVDSTPTDNGTVDGGSTDSSFIDPGSNDSGSTDMSSTDGSTDANGGMSTDPITIDPGTILDGTVQIMNLTAAGPIGRSVKATHIASHTHHHHVKTSSAHTVTTKVKHLFNVKSKIGAHTRASFLAHLH
jgi:hypothetical protein